MPHTQSVLWFLQLSKLSTVFKKRRAWFYHFQYPLKYTACIFLNKQQLYGSFLTPAHLEWKISFSFMSLCLLSFALHKNKKINCPVCCAWCSNRCLQGETQWSHMRKSFQGAPTLRQLQVVVNDIFCQATDGQSTPTVCNSLGSCTFRTALAYPGLVLMSRTTASCMVTPSISVAFPLYTRQTLNRRLGAKPDVTFGPQGLCFGGRDIQVDFLKSEP